MAGRTDRRILWYMPQYTPNVSQQKLMLEHTVPRAVTQL